MYKGEARNEEEPGGALEDMHVRIRSVQSSSSSSSQPRRKAVLRPLAVVNPRHALKASTAKS